MPFQPIKFGPLPHDMVNQALGTELLPGDVYLSVRAQMHIAQKHPNDHEFIMRHLRDIVLQPTWIGQAPRHNANFELVRRFRVASSSATESGVETHIALVALSLELDSHGDYRIVSGYRISSADVDLRRLRGYLLPRQ